jgi:hypothetical protein
MSILDAKPSVGVGVAEICHPTAEELELIPHHRCHVLHCIWYRKQGYTEHPDYQHNEDGALMYHRKSYEEL